MNWWYCLVHLRAEEGAKCPHAVRLGPFETEAEALEIVQRMAKRTAQEDLEDD